MALKIVLEPMKQISENVWEGRIAADELAIFNPPEFREGEVTILLVKDPVRAGDGRIEFRPDAVRVLNTGNSGNAIVIGSSAEQEAEAEPAATASVAVAGAASPSPVLRHVVTEW